MYSRISKFYIFLAYAGVTVSTDISDARRIILINQIALVFVLLSSGYFFVFHQLGFSAPAFLVIPSTSSYLLCIVLNKIKKYNLAALGIIAANCVILF